MSNINDRDVVAAVEKLILKGVTLDQVSQVYRHHFSNLPKPGSQVKWAGSLVATVLENHSNIHRAESGYIRIQNSVGTDIYLLPHQYTVLKKEGVGA